MPKTHRVAIMANSEFAFGRRLIRGVGAYARETGALELYFSPWEPMRLPDRRHVHIDGVIAHTWSAESFEELRNFQGPIVRVGGQWPQDARPVPSVASDGAMCGRVVAEDFLSKGFRNFAYFGEMGTAASILRLEGFRDLLRSRGADCSVLIGRRASQLRNEWDTEMQRIMDWVQQLPLPLAIMAVNDEQGFLLIEACRKLSRHVPEQIIIAGADNSVELCETCNPPLSSVDLNIERVGYIAGQVISKHLAGEATEIYYTIPPYGLIQRRSTDMLAIADADVAQAIRHIRDNLHSGITVKQLLDQIAVSRRALEQRFQASIGRSPRQEIERQQLQRAQQLLAETDWPIKQVARNSGFRDGESLARTFTRALGLSPKAFRSQRLAPCLSATGGETPTPPKPPAQLR